MQYSCPFCTARPGRLPLQAPVDRAFTLLPKPINGLAAYWQTGAITHDETPTYTYMYGASPVCANHGLRFPTRLGFWLWLRLVQAPERFGCFRNGSYTCKNGLFSPAMAQTSYLPKRPRPEQCKNEIHPPGLRVQCLFRLAGAGGRVDNWACGPTFGFASAAEPGRRPEVCNPVKCTPIVGLVMQGSQKSRAGLRTLGGRV